MNGKKKILFVDDDKEIREVGKILLEGEGYSVTEASDGLAAIQKMNGEIDLVILDVMMPGIDGFEVCRRLRERWMAPILFLTARSQDRDKLAGFAAGGDDFLTKPFSYLELTARVKAMIRRYHVYRGKEETEDGTETFRDLTVDCRHNAVYRAGEAVVCTDLEYAILLLLMKNRGRIFSAQEIYEIVWGEKYYCQSNNTVMVHIRNLRKKLGDDSQNPIYIKNVWGKGYRIESTF
jgi:two-component system OmpR family response regulator